MTITILPNKFQRRISEEPVNVISLDDVLDEGATIASLDDVTFNYSGASYDNLLVLASETDGIPAGRGFTISFGEGLDGYEYQAVIDYTDSTSATGKVVATIVVSEDLVSAKTNYYGSVWAANDYFADRRNTDYWNEATVSEKRAALTEATNLIDRLNFKGSKAVSTQALQFPRGTDLVVPKTIKQATYEVANQILTDIDIELEHEDLRTTEDKYAVIRTTRDSDWGPEHVQAGIPSIRAWHLLKPFLRDGRRLKIKRG